MFYITLLYYIIILEYYIILLISTNIIEKVSYFIVYSRVERYVLWISCEKQAKRSSKGETMF